MQLGDALDFYSWSRFPRKRDIHTPDQEIKLGRKMMEEFWHDIKKVCPKAKCFQLFGNHDVRPHKQLANAGSQFSFLYDSIDSLLNFDGVETIGRNQDELIIDGICFEHGFRTGPGSHCIANKMSTVVGHSHQGGVVFIRSGKDVYYELNCGHIADESSVPLSYGEQRRFSKWVSGFGLIDFAGPRFVTLPNRD